MRLHHGRVGAYLHLLRQRAYLECDVDHRIGVHLQDDSRLHIGAKTIGDRFEAIGPHGEIREHVGSVRFAGGGADEAGAGLDRFDGYAGDNAGMAVSDDSGNLDDGCGLSERAGRDEDRHQGH